MNEFSIWYGVVAAVAFALLLGTLGLSVSSNRDMLERTPGKRRYQWGFFLGYSLIVIGVASWAMVFVVERIEFRVLWSVLPTVVIATGVFVVKRRRWAWIVATVLTANPLLWIANYFYGRNRWDEFAQDGPRSGQFGSDQPRSEPKITGKPGLDMAAPRLHQPSKEDYARALDEIESAKVDRGLWAQALAETDGDLQKAKARYIRLRTQSQRA